MKLILFSLLLNAVSAQGLDCDALVAKLNTLRDEFQALQYDNHVDQDRGFDRDDEAISPFQDFDSLKKTDTCRTKVWRAYVELGAAQSPFDGESRAGEIIAKRLGDDKSLKPIYDDAIKKFADHCRSANLDAAVRLHKCVDQDHKSIDKCNREIRFNYPKCIGSKER